ncbi:MAG: hypothetical protein ACE5JX_01915 [Acidobacteriota bacterium]
MKTRRSGLVVLGLLYLAFALYLTDRFGPGVGRCSNSTIRPLAILVLPPVRVERLLPDSTRALHPNPLQYSARIQSTIDCTVQQQLREVQKLRKELARRVDRLHRGLQERIRREHRLLEIQRRNLVERLHKSI